jgi:hypothetical protein
MPDLPGVKKGMNSTLRTALAADWRWASIEQIKGVNGIGPVKAGAFHAKLVAAAWNVTVLPQAPEGMSEPPVLAAPHEPSAQAKEPPHRRSPSKAPIKRWSKEEDQTILDMRKNGKTWNEIATLLGRTLNALRTRWCQKLKPALVAEGRAGKGSGLPPDDLDDVQWESVAEVSVAPISDAGAPGPEVVPSFATPGPEVVPAFAAAGPAEVVPSFVTAGPEVVVPSFVMAGPEVMPSFAAAGPAVVPSFLESEVD